MGRALVQIPPPPPAEEKGLEGCSNHWAMGYSARAASVSPVEAVPPWSNKERERSQAAGWSFEHSAGWGRPRIQSPCSNDFYLFTIHSGTASAGKAKAATVVFATAQWLGPSPEGGLPSFPLPFSASSPVWGPSWQARSERGDWCGPCRRGWRRSTYLPLVRESLPA